MEDSRPGPLSAEFVAGTSQAFDVAGYLVIEDALSAEELQDINRELDELDLPERGNVLPVIDKGPALFSLIDHASTFPYALALVGGNLQLLSSNVTIMAPGGEPVGWHEDGPAPVPYPHVGGRRPLLHLKFGFFLNDLTGDDRGNLMVLPGSHNVPFRHGRSREALDAMPGVTRLKVKAGTAVLFHNGLWHATAPNHAGRARRVLYYTYSPAWHRTYDYMTPPPAVMQQLERCRPERQPLLRQLVGAVPVEGAPGYYFPNREQFPALNWVAPAG